MSNEEYINVINIIYRYNRLRKTMNIKKKKHQIYIFILDSSMAEDFQDPLLELVIASENTDDPETLLKIAERAAANFEVESSSKINLQILEQFTMTKLPMEEKVAATKKQYFVESSDNDFGGNNELLSAKHFFNILRINQWHGRTLIAYY